MASGNDLRDILDIEVREEKEDVITRESLFGDKKKKSKKTEPNVKKPEGMHRELWGLLWTDNKDAAPLFPTDSTLTYKQPKAKIGRSKVRPWKWMPFTNPARKDGAVFYHWRRIADEGLEYPFVRFNKIIDVPTYSDLEYQQHLHSDAWTRQETDHLFSLCKRFDLRFVIVHDRWNRERYPHKRSIEDLKERYYAICHILHKLRNPQSDQKMRVFDANHERRRKEQLEKLFHRTEEQIEEEERLVQELKKIEQRKKEREKKAMDLQKLITAADNNSDSRRSERKISKKIVPYKTRESNVAPESTSIKFPDFKQSGVYLRSQKMKLPISLGQKKTKAIEQMLEEFAIEPNPVPTQEIVNSFNDLRQDMVLLYELKIALANSEYELQTLRHRYETLAPGKVFTAFSC
ncbi:hypothetical protein HELRODRAFT_62417 [Helobdella robusta]|uniref:DNA methyltransferase 1-associated protein 1 n=1 Tax=Helobdella robusta TaxID=6412 RepID=T1FX03_HELRO|nr:hypothetical protein HELRODRAFT_62417 [Helobdella robusta]ESO12570.1 hypothetical protein HELRODRAFT_62417 [Helobdella robusta]